MADDKIQTEHPYVPFPRSALRSREEALRELARPCGGFRSPLSLEERFRLLVVGEIGKSDPIGRASAIIATGVPLNWDVLIRYLHREGVITEPHFRFNNRPSDLPKTYGMQLRSAAKRSETDGTLPGGHASGSSRLPDIAMAKTVGEALERHALGIYKQCEFVYASHNTLSERATRVLDLRELNGFLPWQQQENSRLTYTMDTPLYWARGEMIDGAPAYIPAQLVFWNYDSMRNEREPILADSNSNGAGGHFTREGAILSGLLETIERDGFLIFWLNKIAPPLIDTSDIDDVEIHELVANIERYGLSIHFLNTTTDIGIPSVIAAIIDARSDDPVVVLGGAAGFDAKDTILRSGNEALNIIQFNWRRKEFALPEPYRPFTRSGVGHHERIALWKGSAMLDRFKFFIGGARQTSAEFLGSVRSENMSTPVAQLAYAAERLKRLGSGYEIHLYEAKHPVLRKLGFHVAQTIVPQLLHLYLDEHLATLDSKRLREVPAKLGYTAAKMLNPWPHPFP